MERDPLGNILKYDLNGNTCAFVYDDLYQLTSEQAFTYTADADYCRLKKNGEEYEHNDLMQLISHLEHDQNGNPIQHNDSCFSYDALDRLIQVQTPSQRIAFTYDSDHRRLSKTVIHDGGVSRNFYLYDGRKEIGILDAFGNTLELRILNPAASSEIGSSIAIEMQGKIYAPIHDLMGNLGYLVSVDSKDSRSFEYNAFGEESPANDPSIPWRFASKRIDRETGLVYFGQRYYCPSLGRWLTPDPVESTANLYSFVNNNPFRYVDFFGLYSSDRASDVHFFDPSSIFESNTFSVGTIGDSNLGNIHYHCGINNSEEEVKQAQMALYNILGGERAVTAHWIHDHKITRGLGLVGSEKIAKNQYYTVCPGLTLLGRFYLGRSYMQDVIEYETRLLSRQAEDILKENNPLLKQVHVLFSNASYPFREALQRISPEARETVIAISAGPTTMIENHLAHKAYNIIGEKDWPSRICNGLVKSFIERENAIVQFIEQHETKLGVFGHYFEQPQYQEYMRTILNDNREIYEIH